MCTIKQHILSVQHTTSFNFKESSAGIASSKYKAILIYL